MNNKKLILFAVGIVVVACAVAASIIAINSKDNESIKNFTVQNVSEIRNVTEEVVSEQPTKKPSGHYVWV